MQPKTTKQSVFTRLMKKFSTTLRTLFISGSKKEFKRLKDFITS